MNVAYNKPFNEQTNSLTNQNIALKFYDSHFLLFVKSLEHFITVEDLNNYNYNYNYL